MTDNSGAIKIKAVSYQDSLTAIEYIRTKVFQEEQGVSAELEFDGLDAEATHFLAYVGNEAVGTARIRAIDAKASKIERLAVLPEYRQRGIGTKLMHAVLSAITLSNKSVAIVHAQAYIASMYLQLGFAAVGSEFVEANIPHLKMIKHL